jgi:hypothetical protein
VPNGTFDDDREIDGAPSPIDSDAPANVHGVMMRQMSVGRLADLWAVARGSPGQELYEWCDRIDYFRGGSEPRYTPRWAALPADARERWEQTARKHAAWIAAGR